MVSDVSEEKEANRIGLLVFYLDQKERNRVKSVSASGIFLQKWISAMKHKV